MVLSTVQVTQKIFDARPSGRIKDHRLVRTVVVVVVFLSFSALVANPKKTTLHGGQSRSWSAEQGKKEKEKV